MNQEELFYAETHEWVHVAEQNGDKIATIGITDFAVEQLTDLVYMELPEVGASATAGEEFGEVESVKAVSPMYSPVDGEIIDVNASLPDNLETLSNDAFGEGWILKVKLSSHDALSNLMDYTAYKKQCAEAG